MLGWIILLLLSCSFLMINLPPKRYRNKIWGILFSGKRRLKRAYITEEMVHKDIMAKVGWLCERWTRCMVLWTKVCYQVVLKDHCDVSLLFWYTIRLCTCTASVQSWKLTWMITQVHSGIYKNQFSDKIFGAYKENLAREQSEYYLERVRFEAILFPGCPWSSSLPG